MHKLHERTVVLIKPDAVRRGLIGQIISRLESRGLKIVGLQMIRATREQIDRHYPQDQKWIARLGQKTKKTYARYGLKVEDDFQTTSDIAIGKIVRNWLLDYLTSGPIVKMVVEGIHAVDVVRKITGDSIPAFASPGTIRGDFSVESAASANAAKRAVYNLIHASETLKEAEHEVAFWFAPEEIQDYDRLDYHP